MTYRQLSDKDIIKGFRQGDADIIRTYFYGYCEIGYYIFDQRYLLHEIRAAAGLYAGQELRSPHPLTCPDRSGLRPHLSLCGSGASPR